MASAVIYRGNEAFVIPQDGIRAGAFLHTGGTSILKADSGASTMALTLTPSASNAVITIPDPGTSAASVVLTGNAAQTLQGTYTFTNTVSLNAGSNIARAFTITGTAVNAQYYNRYLTSGGTAQEWRAGLNAAGGVANAYHINDVTNGALRFSIAPAGAIALTGAVTMDTALTNTAASNQLVLSSGVNQLTLNSGTSAAARTYLVPDVGTSADFVMTAGAQTIAGAKTFDDVVKFDVGGDGVTAAYEDGKIVVGNNSAAGANPIISSMTSTANAAGFSLVSRSNSSNTFTDQLYRVQDQSTGTALSGSSRAFDFQNHTTSLLTILRDGNAGIGTSSPGNLLEVSSATSHQVELSSSLNGSYVKLYWDVNNSGGASADWSIGPNNNIFTLRGESTGNDVLTATQAGAVTLGPSGGAQHVLNGELSGSGLHEAKLDFLGGNANNSFSAIFRTSSTSANQGYVLFTQGTTANQNGFAHGLTSALANLEWNYVTARSGSSATHTQRMRLTSAGALSTSTGSLGTLSDAKLKEQIEDLSNGLDAVLGLRPRTWSWKDKRDSPTIGFVAQEVEQVQPLWVVTHEDGTGIEGQTKEVTMGVSTFAYVIKAIQQLNDKIEAMK